MISEQIRLYASHHQFYVRDSAPTGNTDDAAFWSNDAVSDQLAITDGILGMGTGSYGFVTVNVEGYESEPPVDITLWDHVTEAGLTVASGLIFVEGCLSDSGLFFRVRPGHYRVRCCHANLAAAVDSGDGGDWYRVQFWPSAPATPSVIKRWRGRAEQNAAADRGNGD
jgi:hypothetical protein